MPIPRENMDTDTLLSQLRPLIGRTATYDGHSCRVIEVLDEGPLLVLSCLGADGVIQPDQYGNATRRVPKTVSIPVLAGHEYHPAFLALKLHLTD